MSFGLILKNARTEKGLGLRELSSKLGVDHAYLSRLENDSVSPSEKIVQEVSKLFRLSKEELNLASGKLPEDIAHIFSQHPIEAASILRENFKISMNGHSTNGNGHSKTLKPIFETQRGRLYQADCLDLLSTIADESIDCVFADPPFNLNKNYGTKVNDNLAEEHYIAWSYKWLHELVRVLRPGGSLFVYNLPKWSVIYGSYLMRFLTFRHWVAINIKSTLPIPGRLYPSHYSLLYFTKGKPKYFNRPRVPIPICRHCGGDIKDYGGHRKWLNPKGLNVTDVWDDIPPVRHRKYKNRSANELSVKLLQRVLEISTEKNDLVLDPFGGGGTTYFVAESMGRRWLGCEISDCRPIVTRLQGNLFTREKAELNGH